MGGLFTQITGSEDLLGPEIDTVRLFSPGKVDQNVRRVQLVDCDP